MSFRKDHILSLRPEGTASYVEGETEESLQDLFAEILHNGIHGFCFSLFEEGQKPGDPISREQVIRRMQILRPHVQWIRSFSTTSGNEMIPAVAREMNIKTLVGAWLSADEDLNRREIEGLIRLAEEGLVDIAAVGNEVLYRNDLNEEQLRKYIQEVKDAIPGIPVGYVDAYYEFTDHPAVSDLCDVILCNCYPFWEGVPFELSLDYMKKMHAQARVAAKGKPVIITETGWPSQGENLKGAVPSAKNARDYFINTQLWSANENIPVMYFSSFDESWKVSTEGAVGAYWGIWDKYEQLKF